MDRGTNGQSGRSNNKNSGESIHDSASAEMMLHGLENISMLIPEDHLALHIEALAEASNRPAKVVSQQAKSPQIQGQKVVEALTTIPNLSSMPADPQFVKQLEKLVDTHFLDDEHEQPGLRLLLDEEVIASSQNSIQNKKSKKIIEEPRLATITKKEPVQTGISREWEIPVAAAALPVSASLTGNVKEAYYEKAEKEAAPHGYGLNDNLSSIEKKLKSVASVLDTRKIKAELPGLDEPVTSFTRWWKDKVALAFPVEEASRIGAAYVFNRENEDQNYYFIPYPLEQAIRNNLPEEWRDFDAETAWGVATVAGCTGVILTFWLLLYWMTPERRMIAKNKNVNSEPIASAILNIPSPQPEVETHVIIRDVFKPEIKPAPPVKPVPVQPEIPWLTEPQKPISYGSPQIGIFRERTVYRGAPRSNIQSDYVWNARSSYIPNDSELISMFTGSQWNIAQYLPGRYQTIDTTFSLKPLFQRWNLSMAQANLAAFQNQKVLQSHFRTIPSTAYLNPVVKVTQPKLVNAGVYQTRINVENQSHLTPMDVVLIAGNSNMQRLLDTSPGLQEVSEAGLRWHAKSLFPNMTNEYRLIQQTNVKTPIVRSYYQVEVSTQVASMTTVGNLGVSLDLVSTSTAKTGDYVTLEFNISNRTPFPIRNALLKVQLPEIMLHAKGNIIERDVPELLSGAKQQFKLTVLAQEIGVRPVQATLLQANQPLAQDREIVTIQQGDSTGVEKNDVPVKNVSMTKYLQEDIAPKPVQSQEPAAPVSPVKSCECFPTEGYSEISSGEFFEYR